MQVQELVTVTGSHVISGMRCRHLQWWTASAERWPPPATMFRLASDPLPKPLAMPSAWTTGMLPPHPAPLQRSLPFPTIQNLIPEVVTALSVDVSQPTPHQICLMEETVPRWLLRIHVPCTRYVELFAEEVVRGGPAFAVSLVLSALEPVLRAAAELGAWQIISPVNALGRVEVVGGLHEVQDKVPS